MKTIMFFILLPFYMFCQIGINTPDPKATLDVNGNLKVRGLSDVANLTSSSYTILLKPTASSGDSEIKEIDADAVLTAYSAAKTGSWQLLDFGFGSSWYKINLTGSNDTKVGKSSLFTNGVYTAQNSGIYNVNYEFQFQSGVNLEILGGKRLGILKNGTVWEDKYFDAVRVSILGVTVAAIPVTSSMANTLVYLNPGDTITFAVNTAGLLPSDLAILTTSRVSLSIFRVGN